MRGGAFAGAELGALLQALARSWASAWAERRSLLCRHRGHLEGLGAGLKRGVEPFLTWVGP